MLINLITHMRIHTHCNINENARIDTATCSPGETRDLIS